MSDRYGYCGRVLAVDLTGGRISESPLKPEHAREYLGGKGYATRLLYDRLHAHKSAGTDMRAFDAFGPDNTLIFATGPGTGIMGFPEPGRYHVMALRSPLTGSIASANSGGMWGPFLKFAGYDAVVIDGAADRPVYLSIVDGIATLNDAADLWGSNTFDTTAALAGKTGKKCSVACIGQAGENRVPFAAVINDNHRAAGRTGIGAIMGSKNLKAIVVSGDTKPLLADPAAFSTASKAALKKIKENPVTGEGLPAYGTAVLVNLINTIGSLPFKNWQTGFNSEADMISGETLARDHLRGKTACWGCSIACGRATETREGPFAIGMTEGPEFESIWSLGNATAVMDLPAIIKANHLCDKYGLDTISMGSTIACAMELHERGAIDMRETDMSNLAFGNAAAMVEAVEKTAFREGFGKQLALGSAELAQLFSLPALSMSVKKMEMPAYDPRGIKGMGLNYATSNRGGCHVTGYTTSPEVIGLPEKLDPLAYDGKAAWVKAFQDFTCVVNSTVNCLFSTFALGADDYAALLTPITGIALTGDELMTIGERIYNLERLLIAEFGIDDTADTLPSRLTAEPMPGGPVKGEVEDLVRLKNDYYALRGWVNGIPTGDKQRELGLL